MERINGLIVQAVKSRTSPDENVEKKLEIDTMCSLLPFVVSGMETDTVLARKEFTDKDGRLLIHRLFRHLIGGSALTGDEHDEGQLLRPGEASGTAGMREPGQRSNVHNNRPGKFAPSVIESILTDPLHGLGSNDAQQQALDLFRMNIEDIRTEFGPDALTNTDMRRAFRRLGDVTMVDQLRVANGHVLLSGEEYSSLRSYIASYIEETKMDISAVPIEDVHDLFAWEDSDVGMKWPLGEVDPLMKGKHNECLSFQKWRSVRFERLLRLADYSVPIDRRVVRISGSRYQRKNRVRSAAFCEYSTDSGEFWKGGTHTVGQSRSSWSHVIRDSAGSTRGGQLVPRKFGEVLFFMTVEITLGPDLPSTSLWLAYISPMAVRLDEGLVVVENHSDRPGRLYKKNIWVDVEDIVDLIGLIHCEDSDYVCWKDACWDQVVRSRKYPLVWKFGPNPYHDTNREDSVVFSTFSELDDSSSDSSSDSDSDLDPAGGTGSRSKRLLARRANSSHSMTKRQRQQRDRMASEALSIGLGEIQKLPEFEWHGSDIEEDGNNQDGPTVDVEREGGLMNLDNLIDFGSDVEVHVEDVYQPDEMDLLAGYDDLDVDSHTHGKKKQQQSKGRKRANDTDKGIRRKGRPAKSSDGSFRPVSPDCESDEAAYESDFRPLKRQKRKNRMSRGAHDRTADKKTTNAHTQGTVQDDRHKKDDNQLTGQEAVSVNDRIAAWDRCYDANGKRRKNVPLPPPIKDPLAPDDLFT